MTSGVKGSTKLLPFGEFLARKVGVEMRGPVDADITAIFVIGLLKTHVMVSQAHAIGNLPVQDRHCFLCDGPFLRGIRLHEISFVDEKSDIESLLVVTNPAGLFEKVTTQVSVTPLFRKLQSGVTVELGVRQYREGESLPFLEVLSIRRNLFCREDGLAYRHQ